MAFTNLEKSMKEYYLQPAIRGKIADLLDYPVASARVILSGAKLAEKRCTVTGNEGQFMFSRIPPGTYTLEVFFTGFAKLVQRGIAVRDHDITGLDLKMDFEEDSRIVKVRALYLEFINGSMPPALDQAPSFLAQQLPEVMSGLAFDKILFNPPPLLKVGRRVHIELGVYQNLKEEIMRRLLERNVCCLDREQVEVTLSAYLRIAGSRVLPLGVPVNAIGGAGYLKWEWEIMPQTPGRELIHLSLKTRVKFAEFGEQKKHLLVLDREVRIRKNRWLALRQFFRTSLRQ
jgi:hypothetical protein